MLQIETRGSWREMGRQIGEEFREWFRPALDHFASWLVEEPDRYRPGVAYVRRVLAAHCPELGDETLGMAEGAGLEPDLMLGLRYFNELKACLEPGCSGVFIADSDRGPLLARTCDIEPDFSAEIQILRVNRPDNGPHAITTTYLILSGGVGLNAHGLALTGSSAAAQGPAGKDGLPTAVINHLILTRCRTVAHVCDLLAQVRVRGKGAVELVCDAAGASALIELPPGRAPILTHRLADRAWQACSNFCFSKTLANRAGPGHLQNAYGRYGRIAHQAGDGLMERTVDGMKGLLRDIAQPGMVCPEEPSPFRTAYAWIAEPANGRLHAAPGHPGEHEFFEVTL